MPTALPATPLTARAGTPATTSSRLTGLVLAAVFLLPVVLGNALFWLDWRPANYGNHGELVQPPRALPETGLRYADGRPLPTAELRGKWLLVIAARGDCADACQSNLQHMAQVHLALNKDQGRVQRVLVVSGDGDRQSLAEVQRRFPDLLVATLPTSAAPAGWDGAFEAPRRYVVDPQAKVILRYAQTSDPRGVLKDLERLLKYSWQR